jgi:hypothetical protein
MPILDDLILKVDVILYNIIYLIASAQWSLMRGLLMMGYTIELLTQWMATQAFSPLIQQTNDSLRVATSLSFIVALMVLGVTYLLASIIRLDIVSPRNAIMWYIAGALFFGIGPSLYQGMNDFQSSISTAFYLSVLNTMKSQSGSALSSLTACKRPIWAFLRHVITLGHTLDIRAVMGCPRQFQVWISRLLMFAPTAST